MNKQVLNLEELYPIIEEVISSGGEFRLYPRGISMLPLLRQGSDSVVLVSLDTVAKNDMILYRRNDGQFVLHRVIKIEGDEYVMCGDNQTFLEYGIKRENLLAKVNAIYRDEDRIPLDNEEYLKYVKALPRSRRKRKRRELFTRIKRKLFKK